MANAAKKTEHCGPKDSGRKGGYWGHRVDAKHESNRARRENDKKESTCQTDPS